MARRLRLSVLIASAIIVLVATAWLVVAVVAFSEREAVGQTSGDPASRTPAPASSTPEAASVSPGAGLDDFLDDAQSSASSFASASASQGIPDLSAMEVVGNLKYFSVGVDFNCASTGTEGNNLKWTCVASAREGSGAYEVTVIGNDPLTIFSVTAVARGVPEGTAASFFSYVTDLSLPDSTPFEPDAWMLQNVPTGGQTFATGTEISVYGTEEARTLEIVASDTP